jgi:hypothetical protein
MSTCHSCALLFVDEAEPPKRKKQKALHPPVVTKGSPARSTKVSIEKLKTSGKARKAAPMSRTHGPIPQQQVPFQAGTAPSPAESLAVQFPRSRLHGYFGLPYAGEVQVLESGSALPPEAGFSRDLVSVEASGRGADVEFSMAPGVMDKEEPPRGE